MEEKVINLSQKPDDIKDEVCFKYYSVVDGELVEDPDGLLMTKEDAEKAMDWAMDAIGMLECEKQQMHLLLLKQQKLLEALSKKLENIENERNGGTKGIIYGGTIISPDGSVGN